jgi:dihydroxyacetone kinase DhaKLM complex PTS-EIIA-like component DhaM
MQARVLEGQTPDQVVAERLTAKPVLAKTKPSGRAGPCDITKARLIAENAKEVSQPDTYYYSRVCALPLVGGNAAW